MKPGDKMKTWFSGREDGISTVLEVEPYSGKYGELFKWSVKLTANTRSGSLWMSVEHPA